MLQRKKIAKQIEEQHTDRGQILQEEKFAIQMVSGDDKEENKSGSQIEGGLEGTQGKVNFY